MEPKLPLMIQVSEQTMRKMNWLKNRLLVTILSFSLTFVAFASKSNAVDVFFFTLFNLKISLNSLIND